MIIVLFIDGHTSDFQSWVYCRATNLASTVLRINSLISFEEKEENRVTGLFLRGRYGQVKEKTCLYLNERFFVWSLALCDSAIVIMGTSTLSACQRNYIGV